MRHGCTGCTVVVRHSCIEPTFGFAAALLAGAGGALPCLMPALGMKVVTGMPRE